MDINSAREILELPYNFSLNQLKKNYRILALKHHPDKNNSSDESSKKFQEINGAYVFLQDYLKIKEDNPLDYNSLLHGFINSLFANVSNPDKIINIIKTIIMDCQQISIKLFEGLDKARSLKIYEFITQYHKIIHIDSSIIDKLDEVIREKIKDDSLIILNPSLEDLFNDNIYKLDNDNNTYYIPLWHNELHYTLENEKTLIVKCLPDLPEHISIDQNSDIFVYLRTNITSLLDRDSIPIHVGSKVLNIPVKELYIKTSQIYTFKNQGISLINYNDIFDIKKKSSIHIKIELK